MSSKDEKKSLEYELRELIKLNKKNPEKANQIFFTALNNTVLADNKLPVYTGDKVNKSKLMK